MNGKEITIMADDFFGVFGVVFRAELYAAYDIG